MNYTSALYRDVSLSRFSYESGGGEIRTHETFRPSGFQDRRDQPLCHPSRPGAHFAIANSLLHYSTTPSEITRPFTNGVIERWRAKMIRRFSRHCDMFM